MIWYNTFEMFLIYEMQFKDFILISNIYFAVQYPKQWLIIRRFSVPHIAEFNPLKVIIPISR